jgi:hypothetical protein
MTGGSYASVMRYQQHTLSTASVSPQKHVELKEWEVLSSSTEHKAVLMAYNKSHAILTAIELFDLNPNDVSVVEVPEWK